MYQSYEVPPSRDELIEYVTQSNLIEGINVEEGQSLFDNHMMACEDVLTLAEADKAVMHPQEIHRIMMQSQPENYPGEYRQVRVRVGNSEKMQPIFVRPNMSSLLYDVDTALKTNIPVDVDDVWNFHYEFEHIHPFVDGNGRTGRLWMNAIRLCLGMSWLTIWAAHRHRYYDNIIRYEDNRRRHTEQGWLDG